MIMRRPYSRTATRRAHRFKIRETPSPQPARLNNKLSKWCRISGVAGVRGTFDGLGRLADPWLLVRTSLADGPTHGHAIMTDVAAFSGVRLEPGTLYRALSRLERRGWVTPVATAGRRRRYEIAAAWPGPAGGARRGGATATARDVADSQPFIAPGDRTVLGGPPNSHAGHEWALP